MSVYAVKVLDTGCLPVRLYPLADGCVVLSAALRQEPLKQVNRVPVSRNHGINANKLY